MARQGAAGCDTGRLMNGQDFRDSFGLGNTDKGYHSIDAHGVSLASIKRR